MIDWQALKDLAVNEQYGLFGLSGSSLTIIRTAHSILYHMWQWKGLSDELTIDETDEIKAALDELFKETTIPMLIGAFLPYANSLPLGTLPCDGETYSREVFPELYDYLLGSDFIVDEDFFTTPFFPGRVVAMPSEADEIAVYDEFGEAQHTLIEDEIPPHVHSESQVTTTLSAIGEIPALLATGTSGNTGSTGGGEPHNTYQPTIAFNWCIVSGRLLVTSGLTTYYLFPTPPEFDFGIDDSTPVNLGNRFQSSLAGQIIGVRIWRRGDDGNGQIGYLYENDGTLLASATAEDDILGWAECIFSSPVDIDADTTYVAAMYSPSGHFIDTFNGFSGEFSNPPLTALADGDDGDNGVYDYGGAGTFPSSTFGSSCYFIDVILEA